MNGTSGMDYFRRRRRAAKSEINTPERMVHSRFSLRAELSLRPRRRHPLSAGSVNIPLFDSDLLRSTGEAKRYCSLGPRRPSRITIALGARKTVCTSAAGIFKGAKYLNRQFEQLLQGLEALNRQWAQMSPQQRAAQQAQLGPSFSLLNQRLSQLDSISRQRYDNRVGELMGLAGSAGIDWHP